MNKLLFVISLGLLVPVARAAQITINNQTPDVLGIQWFDNSPHTNLPLGTTSYTTNATLFILHTSLDALFKTIGCPGWIDIVDGKTYTVKKSTKRPRYYLNDTACQ